MIPDKIYLRQTTRLVDAWFQKPSELCHNYEYIRKEALLKWINEARAIPHENAIARDLAFQEVLNKLNGM